eukprot:jgi/Picsp_1/421/NSC_00419-R1_galactose kinase
MAEEPTSVFSSLAEAYGTDGEASAKQRVEKIREVFMKEYGNFPQVIARSPGRVNLIGEHIDYEGYGVLPMAIALDTIVAVRRGESDVITLQNIDSKYEVLSFPVDPEQKVDTGKHCWGNYVIGAYKGVFEHLKTFHPDKAPSPVGIDILVDGRVPTGSGLSSSAAIVCSSALAILALYGIRLKKGEVAEFTATAERYVGVISGGMDQAISIMGKTGVAQLVEFNPVRASPVVIPSDATFVIANSMTVSNKAESATGRYNLRVVECHLGSAVLARYLGVSKKEAINYKTLQDVEPLADAVYSKKQEMLGLECPNCAVAATKDLLHESPYSTHEIEEILGCNIVDLFPNDESSKHVLDAFDNFKLKQRALHVFSEKQRVLDFAQICADTRYDGSKAMQLLGSLMDMSHESCSQFYECSSPELDNLVKISKQNGAIGSRLTGAGWGGCTVSLVKTSEVDAFLKSVKKEYFDPLIEEERLTEGDMPVTLFASPPASGGGILDIQP